MRWVTAVLAIAILVVIAVVATAGGGTKHGDDPVAIGSREPILQAPSRRAVVWAVGDGADGGDDARAVARRIEAGRPDLVLYLGDVYDDGTREEFERNFAPVYRRLARRMAPTPGNHDWPNHREGYDPYWRRTLGRPVPSAYALRAGGWKILSLNSEAPHDRGSAQERWLRRQVLGRGTCRLAFWHRPRYSAGTKHGDQPDMQPFWSALRGRATLVLGGHEHNLQRFRPRDGMIQMVSGAGGRSHYPLRRRADLAFGDDRHYGALRLVLEPGRARYAFIAASGATLDSGTVRCRRR